LITPWANIRDYFGELANLSVSFEAMANLVTEIERSRYKEGLFGWTSMHDLCIAQTSVTYPHFEPYLRISRFHMDNLNFDTSILTPKRSSGIEWSMELMGFIDWRGFWSNYIGSLIYRTIDVIRICFVI